MAGDDPPPFGFLIETPKRSAPSVLASGCTDKSDKVKHAAHHKFFLSAPARFDAEL